MAYGIGPTAANILGMPFANPAPAAPAGITDLTRQGWATTMGGYGQGIQAAQSNAQRAASKVGSAGSYRYSAPGGDPSQIRGVSAGSEYLSPYTGAGGMIGRESPMTDFRGLGASFQPWNPLLAGQIARSNQLLGQQFHQQVMPGLNRQLAGAGPGAYGGARAGVAQGLAEKGLADAMQTQTTDMATRGYEAGLGRYVQDRGNNLNALLGIYGQDVNQRGQDVNQRGQTIDEQLALRQQQLGLRQQDIGLRGQDLTRYQADQSLRGQMAGIDANARAAADRTNLNYLQEANQAALIPGMLQQQLGGAMSGWGGQQQQANQNIANWYNQQANAQANYPANMFTNYVNWTSPITAPGQKGATAMGPAPTPMFNAGLAGAGAGLTMMDAWNRSQGGGAGGSPGIPGSFGGGLSSAGTGYPGGLFNY